MAEIVHFTTIGAACCAIDCALGYEEATTTVTTTLSEQIDFFFAPPVPEQDGSSKSTLHLNRREAQDCFLGDFMAERDVANDPRDRRRVFATVMVIAAGIDLLGKFYAGSDKSRPGEVGDRIIEFAERFVFTGQPSAHDFSEVLYYACRNPMLHSFTLHNNRFKISLTTELSSGAIWRATAPDGSTSYVVSVGGLYTAYIAAIGRYEVALKGDAALQKNFSAMFPTYGSIGVFSYVVERRNP